MFLIIMYHSSCVTDSVIKLLGSGRRLWDGSLGLVAPGTHKLVISSCTSHSQFRHRVGGMHIRDCIACLHCKDGNGTMSRDSCWSGYKPFNLSISFNYMQWCIYARIRPMMSNWVIWQFLCSTAALKSVQIGLLKVFKYQITEKNIR